MGLHVRGNRCSKHVHLSDMLTTVADILRVNKDMLKVAGVHPENSVLIKLILPRIFICDKACQKLIQV